MGIDDTTCKAKNRRACAAFAKIAMSALVELSSHVPLQAAIGLDSESEHVLSATVLGHLLKRNLLILDRFYGQAPMLTLLQAQCSALELIALYARRWEQKVFYRELKL